MRLSYAIVFVGDMQRSVAFYRDVIGLPLKFETSHWTEFATEGATVALHAAESAAETRGDAKAEPAGRCRPGLSTGNLDEFHQRIAAANVTCVQEPRMTFGTRIAQYLDPDGLVISVSEDRGRG
jgi:lactoylglutathione lyase